MSSEWPGHHGRIDADALLRHVDSLRRSVPAETGGHALELYHRATASLTVTLDGVTGSFTTKRGDDQGLALRMATAEGKEVGFASVSGSRLPSLNWLVARCRERASLELEASWARGALALSRDLDGGPAIPPVASLVTWLEHARDLLVSDRPLAPAPLELAIEVAATAETWLGDGGLRASRMRSRGWALLRTSEPWARDRASKPVLVARRRFRDLPVEALIEVLEDRRLPAREELPPPTPAAAVLFNPECSAQLVLALVRALHQGESATAFDVGPAWRVSDDPPHPEALYGGTFDDAGFPARRLELADGEKSTAAIGRRGSLRRASYRDRPVAMPAHLVVSASRDEPPDRGVVVTSLDLHPVEPFRWLLRVEGAHLEGGRPGALLGPSYLSIAPHDLVRRCTGTVGPPRLSHLGVETPALIFDDLKLEPATGPVV